MLNLSKDNFFFFYDDCSKIKLIPESIEHAYLAVLNEDLDAAFLIFSKIDSPRAKWGKVLVAILKGFMTEFPTYFQVRNFLEIDLDFLIKNEKLKYIEQFLGAVEILSSVNQEVYKYVARVMYVNKLNSAAFKYLGLAKKTYYNDAELHFLQAKYSLRVNDYNAALSGLEECLKLIPDYYPAIVLKQKIEERWI